MTRFQFVKVWRAWDTDSRDKKRAGQMEDACIVLAPFSTSVFRAELSAGRRAGLDYSDALERAYGVVVPGKN